MIAPFFKHLIWLATLYNITLLYFTSLDATPAATNSVVQRKEREKSCVARRIKSGNACMLSLVYYVEMIWHINYKKESETFLLDGQTIWENHWFCIASSQRSYKWQTQMLCVQLTIKITDVIRALSSHIIMHHSIPV